MDISMTSRRNFISTTAASSAFFLSSSNLRKMASGRAGSEVDNIQDPRLRDLIERSIDASTKAGASYVDARLSHSERLDTVGYSPMRREHMGFGVRALVDGYWGFASSPVWSPVEAVRLGIAAAEQAKSHAIKGGREVDLAPMSKMESGNWVMPVKDDPFEMAYEEIWDFLQPLLGFIMRLEKAQNAIVQAQFNRIQKAFGSSLGQYTTQKLYQSGGFIIMNLTGDFGTAYSGSVDSISPAGMGFELFRDQPLRELILKVHEETLQSLSLPEMPLDVGRYETLINSRTVAELINRTIGRPTEVDTAFGHEANAGGTSFIDPIDMLGNYKLGSSMLNITGDRSQPGSAGLVKWDDEGVEPVKFNIVENGVVVGMQCNREGSGWIKDYLTNRGLPVQSSGCSYASNAMDVPMVHNADLTITPSAKADTIDSLREGIKKGIELKSPSLDVDFQGITGFTIMNAFEIQNGKRIARCPNVSMLFRTPELWGNLIGLGGSNSTGRYGLEVIKGEPMQRSTSSVYAVPALFKEMTFVGTK